MNAISQPRAKLVELRNWREVAVGAPGIANVTQPVSQSQIWFDLPGIAKIKREPIVRTRTAGRKAKRRYLRREPDPVPQLNRAGGVVQGIAGSAREGGAG